MFGFPVPRFFQRRSAAQLDPTSTLIQTVPRSWTSSGSRPAAVGQTLKSQVKYPMVPLGDGTTLVALQDIERFETLSNRVQNQWKKTLNYLWINDNLVPLITCFIGTAYHIAKEPLNPDSVQVRSKITFENIDAKPKLKYDPMLYLSLPIITTEGRGVTLFDCFQHLCSPEELEPDEWVYCERTRQCERSTRKLDIWSAPQCLIVQLMRFAFDPIHQAQCAIKVIETFFHKHPLSPIATVFHIDLIVGHECLKDLWPCLVFHGRSVGRLELASSPPSLMVAHGRSTVVQHLCHNKLVVLGPATGQSANSVGRDSCTAQRNSLNRNPSWSLEIFKVLASSRSCPPAGPPPCWLRAWANPAWPPGSAAAWPRPTPPPPPPARLGTPTTLLGPAGPAAPTPPPPAKAGTGAATAPPRAAPPGALTPSRSRSWWAWWSPSWMKAFTAAASTSERKP